VCPPTDASPAGEPLADPPARSLDQAHVRLQLAGWLTYKTGVHARLAREVLADIDWITASLDALEGEITKPWPRPRWPICSRLVDVAPLTAAKIVGNDWCHQVQQSRATSEALAGTDLIFAGRWCWRSTRHRTNPRGQPLGLSPGPHAGAVSPCVDVLARGAGSRDGACAASDTRGRGRSARPLQ
jgi:hypothetical protein